MALSTNDIVRVTASLLLNGSDLIQNVFHVKLVNDAAQPQGDLRDDLGAWMEDIYDSLVGSISQLVTFEEIQIFNVSSDNPEPTISWPTITAGTNTQEQQVDGVAALVLGRTGVSNVVGKKYFGGIVLDGYQDGLIAAATLTSIVLAGDDWITPFSGASTATWDPGLWTRPTGPFTVFTEAIARDLPAYQRRRKRGVGG